MSERNLKATILNLLKVNHLISTKEILEQLEQQGKSYNKTSVYRSLETLVESGDVCRHYFNDGEALYELKADHHVHLVCPCCGKVTAAECDYQQPDEINGFKVDHHHLTLMGECAQCRKKNSQKVIPR